ENVCQAISNGLVDDYGGYGRINPAAQTADGPFFGDFVANRFNGFFHEGRTVPLWFRSAHFKEKIAKNIRAAFRVVHFWMEFDGVDFALRVFNGADGIFRFRRAMKAFRQPTDVVAVAVPDIRTVRNILE